MTDPQWRTCPHENCELCVAAICLFVSGCNSTPKSNSASTVRSYNGTAAVGDFLTISVDSANQIITYTNYTNDESGRVGYTVNSDGTYTINDPNGNLLSAY